MSAVHRQTDRISCSPDGSMCWNPWHVCPCRAFLPRIWSNLSATSGWPERKVLSLPWRRVVLFATTKVHFLHSGKLPPSFLFRTLLPKMHFFGFCACFSVKRDYVCNVFFIVLDLRLTRLGYSGIPFFVPGRLGWPAEGLGSPARNTWIGLRSTTKLSYDYNWRQPRQLFTTFFRFFSNPSIQTTFPLQ